MACALLLTAAPPALLGQAEIITIRAPEGFGAVIDAAADGAGRLAVADFASNELVMLEETGEVLWRAVERGRGPGEFERLYRLTIAPSGRVLAFDYGNNTISVFDSDGGFLFRHRLPVVMSQVDHLVAVDDTTLFLSGVVSGHSEASGHAVHRFHLRPETGGHRGSFAPLPTTADPEVLRFWGAGGLSADPHGELLYTRKLPYQVYRYTASGRLLDQFDAPFPISDRPEDAVRITWTGRRKRVQSVPGVVRPVGAIRTPRGEILAGRIGGAAQYWDLFTADGQYIGSFRVPDAWCARIGFGSDAGIIWVVAEQQQKHVLLAVDWRTLRENSFERDVAPE